ncbi:MAG: Arginine-tRNA ligase, partial [Candidatus Woesebacteria bacterium GW2011_GWB1_41_10]
YSPNILCNYLYDLASKFNTFYNKCRILPADTTRQVSADFTWRVKLTAATGRVLKTGLNLLGIEAPERM